eukprot:2020266-Rhodomonas_salina.1
MDKRCGPAELAAGCVTAGCGVAAVLRVLDDVSGRAAHQHGAAPPPSRSEPDLPVLPHLHDAIMIVVERAKKEAYWPALTRARLQASMWPRRMTS